MARVSKDQTKLFGRHHRVNFDVHYLKDKPSYGRSEGRTFFFAQPHAKEQKEIVTTHALVKPVRKAGDTVYGFIGNTEAEAIKVLVEYYTWYVNEGQTKEKVIGIRKEKHRFRDDKGKTYVEFDFIVGTRIIAGDSVTVLPDEGYYKDGWYQAREEKSMSEWTFIPHTVELEKTCKEIIIRLEEIQKQIYKAMSDPKIAIKTLTNNKLLTFK